LREHLTDVIAHGTSGQRKALVEAHIAEITLDGDTLTPILLVPTAPGGSNSAGVSPTNPASKIES
jgi:hypothetical protein